TTAGTSSVTLSATNAGGTGNATLTLTIQPPPPVITSPVTASATVGTAFSYQIAASNSPTSFAATGLPAGLTVSTSTGLISGTPTTAGTSSVTLSATNAGGTGNATLTLTIQPPPPVITGPVTASATVGTAFSYQIAASNSPTSFGATGLPAGLTVSTSTGLISGTPTTAGTSTVTLSAANAGGSGNATLTLTVQPPPPVITSPVTASATVGTAFSYQIAASNSPTSFGATGLPAGLVVSTSTGLISGTPTTAGTSSVTLSATNAGGTGNATLTLTIQPPPPVITSPVTATATVGTAFSYQIAASNSPTSFGATGLPAGLVVSTSTGLISGTPTTAGTSSVTLSATNGGGTGNATLTLTIQPPPPVITSPVTAGATVGTAFSYQIAASNSPTSFAATGLPAGLAINTSTGVISGTPTTAGTSTITLSATNSAGTGSATLALTVNATSKPISFVQTTAKAASGSTKSMSVAFASKTAAGDLLLVGFDYETNTTVSVTDSQGNSFLQVGSQLVSPGGAYSRVYYAISPTGGADTVTITLAAKTSILEVYLTEYSGVNQAAPVDVQAGKSGSAKSVSSGNATTTAAGDMIYGYCVGDNACTVGSGFTARSTMNSNLIEDMTAGSAGSYAATGTANSGWTMQMVALRPASAAAPALISARPAVTATTGAARTPHAAPGAGTAAQFSGIEQASKPASRTPGASTPVQSQTVTGLTCTPKVIPAGSHVTCELRTLSPHEASPIQVTTSAGQVKAPSAVAPRTGQTRLTFQVAVDAAAKEQFATIGATAGTTTAQDTIQVTASSAPVITVPGTQAARFGKALRFTVAALDPADLPVQLTASHVPAGASFDAASGIFEWTPSTSQSGRFQVTFGATNPAGQSSTAEVTVNVGSGTPAVGGTDRLSCSPGAIASLSGSGFAAPGSLLSDPSGQSLALGGTRVIINDQPVPVLAASEARVTFLCPAADPGTPLAATVETEAGASTPVTALMRLATPAILSLDGSGRNQGVISFATASGRSTELAMPRNYQVPAHPAQPGDELLIWGSGLGSPSEVTAGTLQVEVGGMDAAVESIQAVPSHAGVYTIQVRVPAVLDFGDALPVHIQVSTPDGKLVSSNRVTIAVEPVSQ
ncbi:MAG TPA: putative Ig domain-containing protein, partial [Bryobacteraceae bacterium]|nr:putative Ig domain-containing protein [Bryobacteraceae bacterium]